MKKTLRKPQTVGSFTAFSGLTRHLFWGRADISRKEPLTIDIALSPREKAIYLLHVAAEVEHALMIQYLYAAYSLGGAELSRDQQKIIYHWRNVLLDIAREEMGHLATVQNILTLIGGPLAFERQDYPILPGAESLYPFPFELEPLTKKSVGKYVLAEMPSKKKIEELQAAGKIEKGEIDEIRKQVGVGKRSRPAVHRVGIIYEKIDDLFQKPTGAQSRKQFIRSEDISPESTRFQARLSEWGLGYHQMIIGAPADRDTVQKVLEAVDAQGEGLRIEDLAVSHFGRFLEIYRQFPRPSDWRPARDVARNPTTNRHIRDARQITHKESLRWAKLLNLRYRMLLMFLAHSFQIEAPVDFVDRSPKGLLISWVFGEMYHLRSIADILVTLPQHARKRRPFAGPPFEMPYSLALSPREPGRWRQHRDLFLASEDYIQDLILVGTSHQKYLKGLSLTNQEAISQITALIGGLRP